MVANKLANRVGAFIKIKVHVQNCNGISWQYLFIGAAIIAGLSSVEWGDVNSVGFHIGEWIVGTCDLCELLELTGYLLGQFAVIAFRRRKDILINSYM